MRCALLGAALFLGACASAGPAHDEPGTDAILAGPTPPEPGTAPRDDAATGHASVDAAGGAGGSKGPPSLGAAGFPPAASGGAKA